tara:strand:- start:1339 stop:1581 length:243 start_codon:yes stop_codon:yes gene_type:complete
MITEEGKTFTVFKLGFKDLLGARYDVLKLEKVGVRVDTLTIDLILFSFAIDQQAGQGVTLSIDLWFVRASFTCSMGRLFG